jgi:hypothetical protein
MFIPDPNFFSIPDPGSRVKKIPDPGSASKTKYILNQNFFLDDDVQKLCRRMPELNPGLDGSLNTVPVPCMLK